MPALAQISDLPSVASTAVTLNDLIETLNQTGTPSSRKMTLRQLQAQIGLPSGAINVTAAPYNVIGDGVADDSAGMVSAIVAAGANGRLIVPQGKIVRCVSKVVFNVAGQTIDGYGATLLFDGPNTSRLADISASNVTFNGVTFDGNNKQPSFYLVSVLDNAAAPAFPGCTFQNITGTATGTTSLNWTYGLGISPYGVTDFDVRSCKFKNIIKYNTTAVVTTPTIGWGFCGGIIFWNGADPTAAQPTPSSGAIDDCGFSNVQTIMDAGLVEAVRTELNDADGVRFYGNAGVCDQFPVTITNCRFRQVSKRAIKCGGVGSANGVLINNIEVDGSGLQYPMVTIIKMDNEGTARSIRYKGGAAATGRVVTAIDIAGHANILVDGLQCDFAGSGIVLGPAAGQAISNVRTKNLVFSDCLTNGYTQTVAGLTHRRIVIEDAEFNCTGNTTTGLITQNATSDYGSGVVLRNVRVRNGSVKINGDGSDIDGLTLEVTSGTYTGLNATTTLLDLGLNKGLGAQLQQWRNITVDARGIATTWNTASRSLCSLIGDRQRVSGLRVLVPNAMGIALGEFIILGDDLVWDGFEYNGPGYVNNAVGSIVGGVFRNVARIGGSTAGASFFIINNAATTNVTFEGVTENIVSSQQTLRLIAGGSFVVRDVITKTTNSTIVDRTGVTACDWSNVKVFGQLTPPTVASVATVNLPDGAETFQISGTTAITSITAAGWEGHTIKLIFQGILTLTDGSNLKLAGNFVTTADDTITLLCSGGNWYEVSRSVN